MNNQLLSISKIFSEKLFRIPDYQRGYAWGTRQLKDFWNDLIQLETDKNHYVGVLTLENVPDNKWISWEDDRWIVESKSFEPLYVVDGQQRLTTTIILIQVIIEHIEDKDRLNYTSADEIRKKFIFDTKDLGISRSYIFGYEKDNPSYEFLKKRIFLENTEGYRDEETIYTANLEQAKNYFIEKIKSLSIAEIEVLYKKVTQHFLFNIYTISNDIDVFVAFETMNNRGKPLSNLELLKNRLIYLSTKLDVELAEKNQLRKRINDSWKAVYHYLGKNKDKPLSDDTFLKNHYIIIFGKSLEERGGEYAKPGRYRISEMYDRFLLEEKFSLRNILNPKLDDRLTIEQINSYIQDLQESVKIWYNINNPEEQRYLDDEEKLYLDKLLRLGTRETGPLLLLVYLKEKSKLSRAKLLRLIERYEFLNSLNVRYRTSDAISYIELAITFSKEKSLKINSLIKIFEDTLQQIQKSADIVESLIYKFKGGGFYKWREVKYFLYEYELSLKEKTKTKRNKIDWKEYIREKNEFVTVEHIYPQTSNDVEWPSFTKYHYKQKEKLCNSLGNLLPLSKPKNSSLQNFPFLVKVDNKKNKVGYRYGSFSENEICEFQEWTPANILARGILLLNFLEERWQIFLGDEKKKVAILGLDFIKEESNE